MSGSAAPATEPATPTAGVTPGVGVTHPATETPMDTADLHAYSSAEALRAG
jgi:hypothetical protein